MRPIATLALLTVLNCGVRAEGPARPRTEDAAPVTLSATPLSRASGTGRRAGGRTLWIASVVALAAANVADAHSSWSKYESNRAVAGAQDRFGARGAAIKGGVNAAWVAGQILVLRRYPSHRALAVVNLAAAAAFGALAWHNYGIGGAPR